MSVNTYLIIRQSLAKTRRVYIANWMNAHELKLLHLMQFWGGRIEMLNNADQEFITIPLSGEAVELDKIFS